MNLEQRVVKLERDNRRLKLASGVVLATLTVVALIGATPQEIPEVIQARAFQVVDENGQRLAVLGRVGTGASLSIGDSASGGAGVVLSTNHLAFTGEAGDRDRIRWHLLAQAANRPLAFFGSFGVVARDEGATVSMLDADGNLRSQLGALRLTSNTTEAVTSYPAAIALYDANGNVIWREPR